MLNYQGDIFDDFHVHVIRGKDQKEWMAKARGGDEQAKLCWWVVTSFVEAMPNEHSVCGCCDTLFSAGEAPQAFIVLIPADPEAKASAAIGVCSECSKHDDNWLVDQGVRREGLAPTTARPGDRIH